MPKENFIEWLKTAGACSDCIQWATENKIKSAQEAWDKLHRIDWMFWLAEAKKADFLNDEKSLRHFAADCAKDVLPFFEKAYPNDDSPRKAIQATRDFADGKISAAARDAAWAAAWAPAGAPARAAAWAAAWAAAGVKYAKALRKKFKKIGGK